MFHSAEELSSGADRPRTQKISRCYGTGINSSLFSLISGPSLFFLNQYKCPSVRAESVLLLNCAECSATPHHTETAGDLWGRSLLFHVLLFEEDIS